MQIGSTHLVTLLDSGSEASFISSVAAARLNARGIETLPTTRQVFLADGSGIPIRGLMILPITLPGRTFRHEVQVMEGLDTDLLFGVDIMARAQITIPPPPIRRKPPRTTASAIQPATTEHTDPEEDARLKEFLERELPLFRAVTGPTDRVQHVIRVIRNTTPIKQRYRPRNPATQEIIDREVDEMLREGVIEPSHSAWSSPVVIVRKKDGKPRFCIDFRRVNDVTEKDAYPLPQIPATLDKLRGAVYLTSLDLRSSYWQVPLSPGSRPITAFTVPGRGLMQFRVMPFGLHSAPTTF